MTLTEFIAYLISASGLGRFSSSNSADGVYCLRRVGGYTAALRSSNILQNSRKFRFGVADGAH